MVAGEAANNRLLTSYISLELSDQFTIGEILEFMGKNRTSTYEPSQLLSGPIIETYSHAIQSFTP